jgi:hypothetical protein
MGFTFNNPPAAIGANAAAFNNPSAAIGAVGA